MTVSELIALLSSLQAVHGDLPVCAENQEFQCYEDVNEVRYFDDHVALDSFSYPNDQSVFIGLRKDWRKG